MLSEIGPAGDFELRPKIGEERIIFYGRSNFFFVLFELIRSDACFCFFLFILSDDRRFSDRANADLRSEIA